MKTKIIQDVLEAANLLKSGEIIAFPTETVYGLGAPIFNAKAIERIFVVKNRPADNPLIAHLSNIKDLVKIAVDIPDEVFILAERFFPGPLTCVLRKHPSVPDLVSKETIAFRIPSHPLARELIHLVGMPLVAPSANLSGGPSPTRAAHVLNDLGGKISTILDGGSCEIGIESTVLSLLDPLQPLLLRPGSIPREELEQALKRKIDYSLSSSLSPGMKYKHYAPKAKVFIFKNSQDLERHMALSKANRKVIRPSAATLYSDLRAADSEGYEEICFLCETSLSEGLMDRLIRASS